MKRRHVYERESGNLSVYKECNDLSCPRQHVLVGTQDELDNLLGDARQEGAKQGVCDHVGYRTVWR